MRGGGVVAVVPAVHMQRHLESHAIAQKSPSNHIVVGIACLVLTIASVL